MFNGPIANLAEMKLRFVQYIHKVISKTLLSFAEHAVYQLQLVTENGGQHIECITRKSTNF